MPLKKLLFCLSAALLMGLASTTSARAGAFRIVGNSNEVLGTATVLGTFNVPQNSDDSLDNILRFYGVALYFENTTGSIGDFNGVWPNDGLAPGSILTFLITTQDFPAGFNLDVFCEVISVDFKRGGDLGPATVSMPEPMTMLLLGTGLAGVAGASRRRRKVRDAAQS